jgi:hypothetical protein
MKHVKLSLINNDQSIQAMADLDFNEKEDKNFARFIEHLKDELATGQTAMLEIEGVLSKPVMFSIAESM